jgi:hypothetical protein
VERLLSGHERFPMKRTSGLKPGIHGMLTARLKRLLKNSDLSPDLKGRGFSRAAESLKLCPRFSAW